MHTTTRKQILWGGMVPLVAGVFSFILGYQYSLRELVAYGNPARATTLKVVGIIIGCIGYWALVLTGLAKLFVHYGLDYQKKNSIAANLFAFLFLITAIVLFLFALLKYEKYSKALENAALHNRGSQALIRLTNERYVGGKGRHYEYDFQLQGIPGRHYDLYLRRRDNELDPGDTIRIVYLPANPTVFREADY